MSASFIILAVALSTVARGSHSTFVPNEEVLKEAVLKFLNTKSLCALSQSSQRIHSALRDTVQSEKETFMMRINSWYGEVIRALDLSAEQFIDEFPNCIQSQEQDTFRFEDDGNKDVCMRIHNVGSPDMGIMNFVFTSVDSKVVYCSVYCYGERSPDDVGFLLARMSFGQGGCRRILVDAYRGKECAIPGTKKFIRKGIRQQSSSGGNAQPINIVVKGR